MKELFGQSLNNTVAESDRIAVAVPGQIAAKNILFSKFWAQLKAIFGVNNWEAREYKSSPCIVVYDKKQYILDENLAPLPFLSENFADELLANIWVALGSTSDLTNYIKKTGETTIPEMASDDAICKTPLYNYYAQSDPRGICPIGWHIPTQAEWDMLATTQGGASVAGGRLKDAGLTNWNSPNSGYSQNTLNFVGSGYRNFNGIFLDARQIYSPAIFGNGFVAAYYNSATLYIDTTNTSAFKDGKRIRCVKDDNIIPTGPVLDADGNSYNFVQLGPNIWLKEDLKTTHYNNGDLIQNIINDTTWKYLTTGARCYYPPINKYKSLVYTPDGDAKLLTPSTPSSETITVDNGAAYDDSVIYDTVTVVVFSNPSSPIVQFQTPQLYQSTVPLPEAGIDPEESPYDPELATGNWWYVGDTLDVSESNTAITYIKGRPASVEISAITKCVHNQTISLSSYNSVLRFDKNSMSGIRPIDIPSTSPGRWVAYVQMVRKQLYFNNTTEIANIPSPSNGDNAIDNSTGFVYAFVVGNFTGIVAIDYFEGEEGSFVKIGEAGGGGASTAADLAVDATGFNGNLEPTDTNQQLVNQKLDDLIITDEIVVAYLSTLTGAISESTTIRKAYFRAPFAFTLTSVYCSVGTAPTGSGMIFNIKKNGVGCFSTKPSIDVSEFSTLTAATPYVLSTTSFAADDLVEFFVDQKGLVTSGEGAIMYLFILKN